MTDCFPIKATKVPRGEELAVFFNAKQELKDQLNPMTARAHEELQIYRQDEEQVGACFFRSAFFFLRSLRLRLCPRRHPLSLLEKS